MDSPVTMSKKFYLGAMIGGWVVTFFLSIGFVFTDGGGGFGALVALMVLFVIGLTIVYCHFWYRAWSAIQDGQARTTPGKAVGFLFIPFFNFYWIFQAIWGYAVDLNAHIARHNLNVQPVIEGMFLAIPILVLVTWIPVLGTIASLALLVLNILIIIKVCDTVNALPAAAEDVPAAPQTQ